MADPELIGEGESKGRGSQSLTEVLKIDTFFMVRSLEFGSPSLIYWSHQGCRGSVLGALPRPGITLKIESLPFSLKTREQVTTGIQPPPRLRPRVQAPPSGTPAWVPPGTPDPQTRDPLRSSASRLCFPCPCEPRPPRAAQRSGSPLASGRQRRRLLPERRRRGRVSHAAGAREPAPPPPSRAPA